MGIKKDIKLDNGIEVKGAYGRIEAVGAAKDQSVFVAVDWWIDKAASDKRIPTISQPHTAEITQAELDDSPLLLEAYNNFLSESYRFIMNRDYPDSVEE